MRKKKGEIKLPRKPKKVEQDPRMYTILIYGDPKIGKTTWCSQFPDSLFLVTEPGTKGLKVFEIEIPDWSTMRKAVRALEKNRKRFKTVVIDTADLAYQMCLDYTCVNLGIPYPGEDAQGREDYGRSWKAVRDEFISVVDRILRTGRGLIFVSHSQEREMRTRSGVSYDRIFPSMGKQPRQVVEALVDMFFCATYAVDENGSPIRVLITQGDETIYAGHRPMAGRSLPALLPLLEEGAYDMFLKAFKGEYAGLDPSLVQPARQTPGSAAKRLRRLSRTAKRKKKLRLLKKGGKTKKKKKGA